MYNFSTIRKTQNFLIEQANIHNNPIINNVDFRQTIDSMVDEIIDKFGGESNDGTKSI